MTAAIVGLLAAAVGVGLFLAGFYTGKKMAEPKPIIRSDTEIEQLKLERERLLEDQNAFKQLLNYNTDTAYQVNKKR